MAVELPAAKRPEPTVLSPTWARLGVIVLALGLLEAITRLNLVDRFFLSPPTEIAIKIVELFGRPDIGAAYLAVLSQIVWGFVIGAGIGIPIGLSLGLWRYPYRIFHPIILLLFAIPQITVLPLFILYFGIGAGSKIAFGASHAVFPILLACIAGARTVDLSLVTAARSMGASKLQLFGKVVIPHALPTIVTGLRLGMGYNLLGVLLAELFVSQKGVGYFITLFTSSFKNAEMFAIVTVLAVIAIIINEAMRALERHLSRWRA